MNELVVLLSLLAVVYGVYMIRKACRRKETYCMVCGAYLVWEPEPICCRCLGER